MATTSRYSTPASGAASAADAGRQNSTTTTSGGSSTTGGSTTETSSSGTSTRSGSSSTNTTNMTPSSLAALEALIRQLMSGGTPQQRADRQLKQGEIAGLQMSRQGYSKDAAFSDAKGLMAQQMRLTLEKLLPGINGASLGAGASQSSMRALLTQRAAENAAENAAAAGLGAAVNYGQVANGTSSVIANLIGQQDPVMGALINALSIAKGAVSNGRTTSTETTNSTGQETRTNSGSTNTTSPTSQSTFYSPIGANNQMTLPQSSFVSYGPQKTDLDIARDNLAFTGTTADTLQQLAGLGANRWSGMTF